MTKSQNKKPFWDFVNNLKQKPLGLLFFLSGIDFYRDNVIINMKRFIFYHTCLSIKESVLFT
ncbi:hypothetical protein B4123_3317 [Bacillus paralicheniformis]|uniref:Uncharacterized protein n=1 Tax=Bacillus paralicheniformis TaxID=1648923 RepID=A0A6N2FSQ0_9BACI|nr:hypothetical protein SC10_B2orf05765 [Bacillus paralicheniformis]MBG9882180.1 hypothetical protein [Bacillus paralicheniformis]OLF98874.1 hypothetical protein B4121_0401 [Bacillus paralicheniformis]OLG04851.1 hypothetical protein B4125_2923 [Bacillus paralicheniformis]OLG10164.1 hypothetical protein B4123_3317 [Bacillus paralicheniformis]